KGREIPRQGYEVFRDDEKVGDVTSGNFSPVIRCGIAMAYVSTEVAAPGTMLQVDVRGRRADMEVTRPPFIRR
ncbi:MAG TPA: glycine cleavage T C-terminal barrel domain-containing protein, partial [Actinomycetota bacterium]|nr:glycine cleavage T C-terminal barrel domain-containing protein [Actinomycetota bacterium]